MTSVVKSKKNRETNLKNIKVCVFKQNLLDSYNLQHITINKKDLLEILNVYHIINHNMTYFNNSHSFLRILHLKSFVLLTL